MATITIELLDRQVAALEAKAAAQGVTPANFARLAVENALAGPDEPYNPSEEEKESMRLAFARIRELRKDVKPDPDGWTVRDYIEYGRQ